MYRYLEQLLNMRPEFRLQDATKRQPVHYAAACSGTGPLKYLLSKGVNINEGDNQGAIPLMIAAECGRLENIPLLLVQDTGEDEEEKEKEDGEDGEGEDGEGEDEDDEEGGGRRKKKKAAAKKDDGGLIEHKDKQGQTALFYAVRGNQLEAIKLLLEKGANINVQDKVKMTPLAHAVMNGQLDCVKRTSLNNENNNKIK